ncbi:uncharacterized protein M6B38_289830 [Iris pallida]|uniref:ENT domain-containing protein n=1 Tax=Iris pallida TaxID=29817 RepID=A0AAX6HX83_IRIPA|nr:uncharacterized protein M6B38_289830 [Iris pallida]
MFVDVSSSRSTGGVSSSRRKSWDRPPGVAQQHHRRKSWDRPLVLAPLVPSQARRFVENGGFRDLHGTVLVVTRDQIPEPLWSRNLRVVAWWTISHFYANKEIQPRNTFLLAIVKYSKEELAEQIHQLELNAYRCTMVALYASGPISWDQEAMMTNLCLMLHISNDDQPIGDKELNIC